MKQKFRKVMHIINSLVSFCHHAGAKEYNIKLIPKGNTAVFEVRAYIPEMERKHLQTLENALKLERSREVEQYYWELGGASDSYYELPLAGMMLDESEAVYEDGWLTIMCKRD